MPRRGAGTAPGPGRGRGQRAGSVNRQRPDRQRFGDVTTHPGVGRHEKPAD